MTDSKIPNQESLNTLLLALSFLESKILNDGTVADAIKDNAEPEQLIVGLSAISTMLLSQIRDRTGYSEKDFIEMLRNKIFDIKTV